MSAVQMRPFCTPRAGPWSGPEDGPPAAAAALPGRLDLGEGHLVEVDRQVAGGCDGHELGNRADDLPKGDGARAAAEDFQPRAVQHVSGQGDGGPAICPTCTRRTRGAAWAMPRRVMAAMAA